MTNKVNFPAVYGGDGKDYTDDSDPITGMGNGGFRARLLPLLANIIAACAWIVTQVKAAAMLADDAATSAANAGEAASVAAVSASTALNAPGTTSTSTTALTVGAGNQLLTVQPGKLFVAGMTVKIANTGAPTNWMAGDVTAYDPASGALTVDVQAVSGGGDAAAWTVSVSGPIGPAGALPPQVGNAGKVLKTDGLTATWGDAGIGSVNATITASATLARSNLYVPVQMASLGQSVTLPAAGTLSTGGPQYVIDNTKGGYPVGIRDNAGTLLMAVAAGGEALVSLKDNSTVAGVWSVTGTNLEPGLITLDSTFSNTYASTVLAPFVALDNNTSIHFAGLSSGFAAFVVDNLGKVVSTPVTVSSAASQPRTAFRISATQAIVFFGSGAGDHQAVVLTLSGASPALSLSLGTPQALTYSASNAAWDGENFVGAPKIAQLAPTLYVAVLGNGAGNNYSTAAISVSDNSVTIGAPVTIASSSVSSGTTIYALTATTALVIYKGGVAGHSNTNSAVVVSVSGTTCAVGAAVAIDAGNYNITAPSSVLLSPTKALIADDANGNQIVATALTIAGATVTAGPALTVDSAVGTTGVGAYVAASATRYNPHLSLISAGATNTALLWYIDSGSYSRAVVLSENGGTITAGTKVYSSICSASANMPGYGYMLMPGTSEFLAIKQTLSNTAGWGLHIVPSKISGSTITSGDGMPVRDMYQYPPMSTLLAKSAGGDYLLASMATGNVGQTKIIVARSNGDAIVNRGGISVPEIWCTSSLIIPQVSGMRFVWLADTVANAYSSAGWQLRLLNLEIAA